MENGETKPVRYEVTEVFRLGDFIDFLRDRANREQAKLSGKNLDAFRETILGNQLPSPELTDTAISEAVQMGRYQALRDALGDVGIFGLTQQLPDID